MALTYPITDLFDGRKIADQKFPLIQRQELSRQANGATRGKDLGSALWRTDIVMQAMRFDDALDFEAMLNSLDGVINEFEIGDFRRKYPRRHADGSFVDSGLLNAVGANNDNLAIDSLPAGLVLSRGDYLSFDYGAGPSRALHQVMNSVQADAAGLAVDVYVRPHIRTGATIGAAVTLRIPTALMSMEPKSISSVQSGNKTIISFSAVQVL